MIKKWLHINEMGGDPWIRPIWGAVIEATKAGEVDPLPKNVTELGLHISTRLDTYAGQAQQNSVPLS